MPYPRDSYVQLGHGDLPVTTDVAKEAVKEHLHGVVGLSGLLCNGKLVPSGQLLRGISTFGDSMHNSGGHAKDHFKGTLGEIPLQDRNKLKRYLKSESVLKESMTLAEWVYACLSLCLPADELDHVDLPDDHVKHAFDTADLRRLFYVNMHTARSRGYILAVWCSLSKFVFSMMKCHWDGKETIKSACSTEAFYGLYSSGCVDLTILARLVAPEQGCCENGEGALKPVKDLLLSRSNFQWDDALVLLRRSTLARAIDKATNTPASAISTRVEARFSNK